MWYRRYRTAVIEELEPEEGTPEQEEAVAHERAKAWEESALSLVCGFVGGWVVVVWVGVGGWVFLGGGGGGGGATRVPPVAAAGAATGLPPLQSGQHL